MTTHEFYAQALLAAFPVAASSNILDPSAQETIAKLAHAYAAALTETFKQNQGMYQTQ